jgi:ribosome modulation factor
VGVLIALAAEQAINSANRRSDAQDFRAAVDAELSQGLATYVGRVAQAQCVDQRLNQLEQWLAGWREGRPKPLRAMISAPRSGPAGTSVWQTRDPDVVAHMPLALKLAYASLYDEMANYEVQRLDERMTWFELAEFDRAENLSAQDLMRLQGLITRARWRAGNITGAANEMIGQARKLGIRPATSVAAELPAELCKAVM